MRVNRRPCSVYRCPREQEVRVFYLFKLGKTSTRNWAKVCRNHSVKANFPISWGVIVKVESIK